jgi:hypothetical protein
MKTLAKQIAAKIGERAFCVVFEDDLERCWPSNKMAGAKRNREIQNFAESHGWTAAILEGAFSTRAIFEGRRPGFSSLQLSEHSPSSEKNNESDVVRHQ